LATRVLSLNPARDAGLAAPRQHGLPIDDWHNTTLPVLEGRPLLLDPQEISRSLAVHPAGDRFVLGAGISEGRVFRAVDRHRRIGAALSDQSVALIIKRRAAAVGLDPENFAGHSLRAGLATAAAAHGVEERIIMRQTRHVGVTVRRYIRDGEVFVGNPSGRVGL
jgi:integrase